MADEVEPNTQLTPTVTLKAILLAIAAGGLFVLVPYGIVWLMNGAQGPFTSASGFTGGLVLLFPIVQGFALGLALGPKKYNLGAQAALTAILLGVEIVGAYVFLREGIICLIIMAPLVGLMMFTGTVLGRAPARRRTNRALQVSVLPLFAIAVFAEALGPIPNYESAVADSVVINAPPEYVWRYIVEYPENTSRPEYWLWRVGLPHPTQSVATAAEVGATRMCNFSDGIAFEERIVELVPNEVLTFDVTRQPDHPEVIGHFQFDRGQIRLTRNADGTTTVTATSWYRLFVRPAVYFDWWTADITRQVHFRVLNHIKGLAERDYQAEQT